MSEDLIAWAEMQQLLYRLERYDYVADPELGLRPYLEPPWPPPPGELDLSDDENG